MYLRLGFSVAINVDPDVLLFDEILAVGDAEFQQRCAQKFVDLKERGKTIVIVSHALETIRNFCDEAVLLDHGRVRLIGPAGNVVDEYLEGVHIDRQNDEREPGSHHGSGQIRVERVRLLDAGGKPTTRMRTGDAVTVRIEFVAAEPIERPVFGLGFARIDGAGVSGPNTRDAELVPDKIEGRGHVDYRIDRCLLLPGTYDVSAVIFDYTISSPYDVRNRALRFDVERGTPFQRLGVVTLDGVWDIVEDEPSP
jgi:ABC-2 type transport system ATP-binding protein